MSFNSSKRSINRLKRKKQEVDNENYLFNLPDVETSENVHSLSEISLPFYESGLNENVLPSSPSSQSSSLSSLPSITNATDSSESENFGHVKKSDFAEAVLSSILAYPGVSLSAAEKVVNLFNIYLNRYSKESIQLPNIRYFWDIRAKNNSIGVYTICDNGHSHGPFCGEPRYYGDYECDGKSFAVDLVQDKYFLHIFLRNQLETHLPLYPETSWNDSNFNNLEICNSSEAKRIKSSYVDSTIKRYTLTLHVDEVAAGGSSKAQIFPIFFTINEMSKKFMRQNFFLVGLFVGHKKPPVEIYLGPIVQELISLSENPIVWKFSNTIEVKSTFHLVAAIADAPMRAYLRNVRQFNHLNGCDWCLITAGTHQKAREYPILSREQIQAFRRKKQDFLDFENFLLGENDLPEMTRFRGLIGPSPLLKLKDFDIVNGFSVEPMHCIILGIVRSIFYKSWLSGKLAGIVDPGQDRNSFKTQLGSRLKVIKVPSNLSRPPRELNQINYWKSAEYDSFLCYYFPCCSSGLFTKKVVNNTLCLARIYSILNSESISLDMVSEIRNLVDEFQSGVDKLYGKCQKTYNLHILSHLADSVSSLGPFANLSAYPVENQMGILKDKVRRSFNIAQNLVRVFLNDFNHRELMESKVNFWPLSNRERKTFGNFLDNQQKVITMLPDESIDRNGFLANQVLDLLLRDFGLFMVGRFNKIKYLKTISIDFIRYSSRNYADDKTRNDSVFRSVNGTFYQIEIILEVSSKILFVCNAFKSSPFAVKFKGFTGEFMFQFDHIHKLENRSDQLEIIKYEQVKRKSFIIKSLDYFHTYKNDFLVEAFLHNN